MSTKTVNLVVIFLGLIALAVTIGGFVLAYHGTDIPAALIGLGGTAVGGIAGILARPNGTGLLGNGEPPPAQVVPNLDDLRAEAQRFLDHLDQLAPPGTKAA